MPLWEKHGHLLFKPSLDFQSLALTFAFSRTRQLLVKRVPCTAWTGCWPAMAGESWARPPPSRREQG